MEGELLKLRYNFTQCVVRSPDLPLFFYTPFLNQFYIFLDFKKNIYNNEHNRASLHGYIHE